MSRAWRLLAVAGTTGAALAGAYAGLVTGRLTVDLGVGRRTRPLGPLTVEVAAPREVVYAVATAPYGERRPRAMREKVEIWERGDGMVLAAHRTPVGGGLTAVTVETVTFTPPERIAFRVVRGPVPHVVETFELTETPTGTLLHYTGEMGTDLGPVGQRWGDLVERSWVATVRSAFETIRVEAERQGPARLPAV